MSLRGEWFEVGSPTTTANSGNFTLTMATTGLYFTGTWGYGNAVVGGGTWDESRVNFTTPSATQCFSSPATVAGTHTTCTARPRVCSHAVV